MQRGILGGTGPAGRGVAVCLAEAGVRVTPASLQAHRAESEAKEVVAARPEPSLPFGGTDNEGISAAEVVVLVTPWDSSSAIATAKPLRLAQLPGQRGREASYLTALVVTLDPEPRNVAGVGSPCFPEAINAHVLVISASLGVVPLGPPVRVL